MTLSSRSASPGLAVPGIAEPGLIMQGGTLYPYYGQVPLDYLDYLDASSGHTLVAIPGGSYLMAIANSRAGLTVPPPDGRWTLGGGLHLRHPAAAVPLSAAEVRAAAERALAVHGHYPGGTCAHCDPVRDAAATPPLPPLAVHGHYAGSVCRQCDPAPAEPPPLARRVDGPDVAPPPPARPPVTAEEARAAHGHYPGSACRQCDPVPPAAPPPPLTAPAAHGHYPGSACRQCDPAPAEPEPVTHRAGGPDFAPRPSLFQVRADLEQSRVAHGHYAPGGCQQCMTGGEGG